MPTTRKESTPSTKPQAHRSAGKKPVGVSASPPAPAKDPKPHRSPRSASKKSAGVLAPSPISEFDATRHHDEIAKIAYLKWLERAGGPGSPEEDWLKAESEVRAGYTQQGT